MEDDLQDGWDVRHPPVLDLILRSRVAASRRMNGTSGATWFETALKRLLTMRVYRLLQQQAFTPPPRSPPPPATPRAWLACDSPSSSRRSARGCRPRRR